MVMNTVFRVKKLKATPKPYYNKKIIIKRKSLIIYTALQKWIKPKDMSSMFQIHKATTYTSISQINCFCHNLLTLPINWIYRMEKKAIFWETEFIIHNNWMIVKNTLTIPYPTLKTAIRQELPLCMSFPKNNPNLNGFSKKRLKNSKSNSFNWKKNKIKEKNLKTSPTIKTKKIQKCTLGSR